MHSTVTDGDLSVQLRGFVAGHMYEPHSIHTIGHSTRTIPEFVELLRVGNVEMVVDNGLGSNLNTAFTNINNSLK
jgi:hypothetical protein